MNSLATTLADLFAHNRWANESIARLAAGLSTDQLEVPLPIGLGTFRATYWHICGAEEVWLARWQGVASDPTLFREVRSVEETTERLRAVDQTRSRFFSGRSDEQLREIVSYRNFAGNEFSAPLAGLALHVANHGVHHRAQLLQFLKKQNRQVVGGLDYIFYKLTSPTVAIPPDVASKLRNYGLTIGETVTPNQPVHRRVLEIHHTYGMWMMNRLFEVVTGLSDSDLDRDFQMGTGTLRKTLTHILDAENFWLENYLGHGKPFPQAEACKSITELQAGWAAMCERRASDVRHTSKVLATNN